MAAPILPHFSFSSARWEKNGIVWDRRQNGEGIPQGQRIPETPLRGIPGRRGHRLGVDQLRIRGNLGKFGKQPHHRCVFSVLIRFLGMSEFQSTDSAICEARSGFQGIVHIRPLQFPHGHKQRKEDGRHAKKEANHRRGRFEGKKTIRYPVNLRAFHHGI